MLLKSASTSLLLVALLAGCAVTTPRGASSEPEKTYTVRDIYSRPGLTGYGPENLQWKPDGSQLAFLQRSTDGQLADLYVMDVATGQRSVLISAETLAGAAKSATTIKDTQEQERITRYNVSSYHWSPQGDAVLFSAGEQLELFDLASGKARVITRGEGRKLDPKLSPDQRHVSYVVDGDLYVAPLGGKARAVIKPRAGFLNGWLSWVYTEELALRTAYEWSPDSKYIAFLQFDRRQVWEYPLVDYLEQPPTIEMQKYPKAGSPNPITRLGIYNVKTGRTTWVPVPSGPDIYLARFGWLPDSGKVYAMLLDREQKQATIYLSDSDADNTRVLLRITDPYWIDIESPHFLADGRFIWPNQSDGWHHLQLYSAKGEKLRTLTPGDYNVIGFEGVDEKNGWAYFTRYTDDGLRSQLYRAALSGGAPEAITQEPGVHRVNMSPDAGYFVEYYSNATTPYRVALKQANGTPVTVLREAADLSAYALLTPQFVTYTAADGKTELPASILLPPDFDPNQQYPVIMYQYGGPGAGTLVQDAFGGSTFLFEQLLARDGFIIFHADNRLAGQMSHTVQGQRKYNFGAIELQDQLAAVKWLQAQSYVDDSNIGIWGWSYGGYMTAYELNNAPGVWDAGISVAPVTQWEDYDTIYTERYMGTPQAHPQAYEKSSTLTNAGQLEDPLLLVHGTGDDNVHFQNIHHLVQAYIEHDADYQLLIYPNKTHGIAGEAARTHLFTAMRDFWNKHLKDGE